MITSLHTRSSEAPELEHQLAADAADVVIHESRRLSAEGNAIGNRGAHAKPAREVQLRADLRFDDAEARCGAGGDPLSREEVGFDAWRHREPRAEGNLDSGTNVQAGRCDEKAGECQLQRMVARY